MDFRSSALVPALYLGLGVAVVSVVAVAYVVYRPPAGERVTEQFADATRATQDARFRTPTQVSSRASDINESYAKTVQRMLYLEELLEKQTRLLERKSTLLEQKDVEYLKLKQEVDDYLMLISELTPLPMPQPAEGNVDSAPVETVAAEQTATLRKQLEQLRTRLSQTEQTERELEADLSSLKTELNNAYAEIAEQQLVAVVVRQEDPVSAAAARVLVGMGAEAIPEVVEMFSDRRAEVRAWAATVIGRFGPLAQDSVPRLRTMLTDQDVRVRDAARRSIDLILD